MPILLLFSPFSGSLYIFHLFAHIFSFSFKHIFKYAVFSLFHFSPFHFFRALPTLSLILFTTFHFLNSPFVLFGGHSRFAHFFTPCSLQIIDQCSLIFICISLYSLFLNFFSNHLFPSDWYSFFFLFSFIHTFFLLLLLFLLS